MNCTSILLFSMLAIFQLASSEVVLIAKNTTLSFDDAEADFAPTIKSSGECGVLFAAQPLDACSDLTNDVDKGSNVTSPFVLIIRGGCKFDDKVRRAQKAGFKAAIVYDNEDDGIPMSMAGSPSGIKIHAVFVTKASGEILKKYAGSTEMELWLIPSSKNSGYPDTRRHVRSHPVGCPRMSISSLQNMPTVLFKGVVEEGSTSVSCAICIEDYKLGDMLRILPCHHKFHRTCIDTWLTTWRSFCPLCKHDARTSRRGLPASERTPLLSSSPPPTSSSLLSPSQTASDLPMASTQQSPSSANTPQVAPSPTLYSLTVPISHSQSHASMSCLQQSYGSFGHSPTITVSQSSVDLSKHIPKPLNTGRAYRPSPSNASPNWVGSSSHQLELSLPKLQPTPLRDC